MSYGYNLAGAMTSQTYPSGRVITTEYDTAGRLAGVKKEADGLFYAGGAATDSTNRIQYTAHGAMSVMKLGNGLWEHTNFNLRLQPTQIGLGSASTSSSVLQLDYAYGTTTNNGNVQSQTITVPTIGSATGFTATQTYGYDSLNRLSSAQENNGSSWTQNFSYDRYGNRNFATGTTLPASLGPVNSPFINALNNRLDSTVSGQTNVTYDPAGNLTHDVNGHAYVYDGENKQTTYEGGASASGGATYYYDGDGQRVKKVVGGSPMTSTVFVYDIQSQLVAEYSDVQPTSTGGTSYLTEDTLGTPRVDTDASGNVRARHDYQPFGEELYAGTGSRTVPNGYAGDNVNQKFTQKERDNETGLDYFLARYYSSTQGRFISPDEFAGGPRELFTFADSASANPTLYADLTNPQSLNKYQYAYNNPLRYIDPDGHDVLGYELIINGPNNILHPDNREQLPDIHTLGPQTTSQGGNFNLNLKVNFDKGDNIADYEHVRAAIVLNSNEPIRNDGIENPSGSQQTVVGQSRFVTDDPGINTSGPRAGLAGATVLTILAAGEYDKKTNALSSNVAYYAVQVSFDKKGAVDMSQDANGRPKTFAQSITRNQFIALMKQYGVRVPKNKKSKAECPECLLSPPNEQQTSR